MGCCCLTESCCDGVVAAYELLLLHGVDWARADVTVLFLLFCPVHDYWPESTESEARLDFFFHMKA
jgi:hypothetical protein